MGIFKNKKRKEDNETLEVKTMEVEKVKVATTGIVSSYDDGSGLGPRCLKWYFLVYEVNGEYHEIFSNRKIEKALDTCHKGTTHKTFNTPYIEKLEPLSKFLKNPEEKLIELDILFDFILDMNVKEVIEK